MPPFFPPFDYFNPRSPYGERPRIPYRGDGQHGFQSTLPLRGATDILWKRLEAMQISIHAPLTGSDFDIFVAAQLLSISIHAPLTGSDFCARQKYFKKRKFQSTLPLRGATFTCKQVLSNSHDFNPRSPYGERRPELPQDWIGHGFQSTLPLRGATCGQTWPHPSFEISIHAPLTGSDAGRHTMRMPPCVFQSTLPLRGATASFNSPVTFSQISIHAPLTGSDLSAPALPSGANYFNPRSPYGERLISFKSLNMILPISIHAPLTGSDLAGPTFCTRL